MTDLHKLEELLGEFGADCFVVNDEDADTWEIELITPGPDTPRVFFKFDKNQRYIDVTAR
jgi:hypothetical protein